ncbi:hypothetical protein HPP92_020017 [Vanilla planifolia]|uniref:Protein kinase domain-containing protein n=1 Tax=Vanilla planifolia TaxID=51239 RepID=A0A835Q3D5_VANPL|nr:hypothetical protein HPP92_020017 [Vanilla planifolia]
MESCFCSLGIFLLWLVRPCVGFAEPVEDKRALLDFQAKIPRGYALNWSKDTSLCGNWRGVRCDSELSRVIELRLPGIGFNSEIPPGTLSHLSGLRILSLGSNGLTGHFPPDFSNFSALTEIHLQLNNFSGPLPSDFSPWKRLTVLDLSYNYFEGNIPSSISNLTHLAALNLSNNSITGHIPDLHLPKLKFLNLSNNYLNGSIPKSLQGFPDSSFCANELSRTFPAIHNAYPSPLPISNKPRRKRLSEPSLLGIVVGVSALVFAAFSVVLLLRYSRKKNGSEASGKGSKSDGSPGKMDAGNQDECKRLVFFEGSTCAFDLEDLLRASAEVLGKGTLGTAYKAVMEDSTTVVVKRLKEVAVGRRELEQLMEVVGKIRHENVVELKAYYYSKNEKLMVYDYYSQGSVFAMLHGKQGEGWRSPDWETRLRIALGTARGIAHIHSEHGGKLVHGNIKSSNVFLNHHNYGCVSEACLTTISNPRAPRVSRISGYGAPEVVDARKASQASDVFSYGVLLLELLTGKSPVQRTGCGREMLHIVRWVQSVVREEWTAEVFDVQLMIYPNIEEGLVQMLQIAMACVARMPEQRPKMAEVVRMIEEMRSLDRGSQSRTEATAEETYEIQSPLK